MTEEEAKTKWCPFARTRMVDSEDSPSGNRTDMGDPDLGAFCIGSACMAWRWANGSDIHELERTHPDIPTGQLKGFRDTGYCGLAGKP
jgi:hypothetical protein